ncbi:hypothetical protein [Streptomyces liliifuscus]|uniref:Uncharacterized protein n=1 Tax=Streptomyces liliifuscus TaxID=2797636 RepID=A0A7T7RFR7_9ACTN|nr:hypothetical protein [Streptomyces liliifuscus]QQM44969.1 hypothetical protein JEQ17_39930 [Streptomyces liliifuscus]
MPHTPKIKVLYRTAEAGEIRDDRTVQIEDQPGSQSEILLHRHHTMGDALPRAFTRLSGHQIVHGSWRQRWTDDGRMTRPPQGLGLAVSRWEAVPADEMPAGQIVFGLSQGGSCVWLIDDRYCTERLVDDMNALLLRLAGDGLWIQCWFRDWPPRVLHAPPPLLTPSSTSLVAV